MTTRGPAGKRRLPIVAAILSAALLLTACTGDGEVSAFRQAFAEDAAVESLDLTSHDNQPFTGGVSGEVYARDGIDDAGFDDLAARLSAYTRENAERMQGRVTLIGDGVEMIVTGDAAVDEGAVRMLALLRDDARVTDAVLGESSVAVVGTGATDAVELARELPALVEAGPWRTLSVRSDDDTVVIAASETVRDAALRAWDALSAAVPLSGVRARDDSGVVVTLRSEADLARARELAAQASLGTDPRLAFASDVIRLGDSDGEDARVLLARLDERVRTRISTVWISGTRMQVALRSGADPEGMTEAIDAALPARIDDAWIVADEDDTRIPVRPAG